MDCNKTEVFLKERGRMCESSVCSGCKLSSRNNGRKLDCREFQSKYQKETIAIVQEWSDSHQPKTRKDVFFEAFPNADRHDYNAPTVCTRRIFGYDAIGECISDCVECWNTPIEDA